MMMPFSYWFTIRAALTITISANSTNAARRIGTKKVTGLSIFSLPLPHALLNPLLNPLLNLDRHAFHRNNPHTRTNFTGGVDGLCQLGPPLFAPHFHDAAVTRRDALGDHAAPSDNRVDICRLFLDVQFRLEPVAQQCEI